MNPYITICLLKWFDRHPFSMFISMKFIFFDCGTFHNLDSDWFSPEVTAVRFLLLTSGKPSYQWSSRKPHIARSTVQFLVTNLVISLSLLSLLNTNDNSFILNTLLLINLQTATHLVSSHTSDWVIFACSFSSGRMPSPLIVLFSPSALTFLVIMLTSDMFIQWST